MIRLEKAPQFSKWLYEKYGDKVAHSLTRYSKGWEEMDIFLTGEKIGLFNYSYEGIVQYQGRLPGYFNELSQDDRVTLIWDNKKFVAQVFNEGPGYLKDTPWQRQDGHDEIPFP
jgi:hypothetical protein